MNAATAKLTSLIAILNQLGAKKDREDGREAWYFSPFRNERTASFKVFKNTNTYIDFGGDSKGNVLDFIMSYYNCDFKESLKIVDDKFAPFSFHQPSNLNFEPAKERKKTYQITAERSLSHKALIHYMKNERQLHLDIARKYCKEIHYTNNGKRYFTVGFKNDLGGYATRNKYIKLCLGKQAITTINNKSKSLMIFEGSGDFIAYLTVYPYAENEFDFIILNSISGLNSLLKTKSKELQEYEKILACLDNDDAGENATNKLLKAFPNTVEDQRYRYADFKDFNDFLIAIKKHI